MERPLFEGVVELGDVPLVVNLDGTLLRSDILSESGLQFLRNQPRRFAGPIGWMMRGKSVLSHRLAQETELDVATLPYDRGVLALIDAERERGRRLVLATASPHSIADRIAAHLALFDEVLASEEPLDPATATKRDRLVHYYGVGGFDYAGNSHADLPIWSAARSAYVVNASPTVERRARQAGNVAQAVSGSRTGLHEWIRALRLYQWIKNSLIFLPMLAAHHFQDASLLSHALFTFVCFGLCASSAYILNDLLDLADDRHHAIKRLRPFASGQLPIRSGLAAAPLLLALALWIAWWQLPLPAMALLGCYYALTLAYSLVLKRQMMIDVMTLAGLYTMRIIVGAVALAIPLSSWLLALSMFLFLSLAMAKRYAELHNLAEQGDERQARGRGYSASDRSMIAAMGAAAGYIAVLVLALYINDPRTADLYQQPTIIWLACPLALLWISRVWMLTFRGQMNEDPVLFAVRDRDSLIIGALATLVFALAL